MVTIRLLLAGVTLLIAAMTTFVTVTPQPASARTFACIQMPDPVLA